MWALVHLTSRSTARYEFSSSTNRARGVTFETRTSRDVCVEVGFGPVLHPRVRDQGMLPRAPHSIATARSEHRVEARVMFEENAMTDATASDTKKTREAQRNVQREARRLQADTGKPYAQARREVRDRRQWQHAWERIPKTVGVFVLDGVTLTQKSVARAAGVAQSTVSRWTQTRVLPGWTTMAREALG